MYEHKWAYQAKVIKIVDGQTLVIWVDLGFDIWKKVLVRLNRVKAMGPYQDIKSPIFKFLEQNLKGKKVICHISKQKGYNGFDKFFAEIYGDPRELPLKLKDINISIKDKNRIEGYINLNDFLVGQNLATYI